MARYVLLKMGDEAAERLVVKAGARAVGVWDIPSELCECPKNPRGNWFRDPEQQRPLCKDCKRVHPVYLDIGPRVRWAFGRNILAKLLDRQDDNEQY